MIKKEELFVLIHTLSKSEKRYFRLFCTREASGRNYLKLFDVIDGQYEYDEQAIKAKFMREKFIRQLHVTKNYLRNLILKSLRNFHAGISKDAELKDILRNIEILYNKELYLHCETELKRARSLATKYELLPGLIEVENWRRKLDQTLRPHDFVAINTAVTGKERAIKQLQNNNDYWKLAVDVSKSLLYGSQSSTPPIFPEEKLTLEAKVLHYNVNYLIHLQSGEISEAQKQLYTVIGLLEKEPRQIQEEPGLYVSTINNMVSFLIFNKQYEEAMGLIRKAKLIYEGWKITSENRTLLKQILRTYNAELEIYRDSKTLKENITFIESTETFVKTNLNKIPKEYLLSFWFQLASIHFMGGNFSRSLEWNNKLLNSRFKGIRTDLQTHAHILNLMIHFEQQNLMVLRYYVDSAKRYIKKIKEVQPFEEVLLKFFVKIGRIPLLEYKEAFAELKKCLYPESNEHLIPEEKIGYIDYREWIDGKLKSFSTSKNQS